MANLWEKVKNTLEQGSKAVKESAESVARTVSEKAPGIASTVVDKSKEFADTVGDKAHEMLKAGHLKVEHYNLNRDVSELFNKIGGKVYELMKSNKKNIYANQEITKMIEKVKDLESQIDEIEEKMEEAKKPELDEGKEKSEQADEA